MESLRNWHNSAQFPFCASWCQQAAVITEVKKVTGCTEIRVLYVTYIRRPL